MVRMIQGEGKKRTKQQQVHFLFLKFGRRCELENIKLIEGFWQATKKKKNSKGGTRRSGARHQEENDEAQSSTTEKN